ncbi:MAG: sugar phosphate isomerase/epimerase [Phycisphaerae bacterium]|nr:sugar phosphate isomerase/epimerase [Phycisphaerae bacterium]MDW8261152.1 sugar phosphate isomerase/epimerase family protein [Phycisphaerales bacterium]
MKIAFSTNAFTRFPLDVALRAIRQAGFPAVEILADVPHAYPDQVDESLITSICRQLEQLQLKVSNVNANCSFGYWRHAPPEPYFEPSLISPDPKHRADRIRLILKTIEFARRIGARNISITSGRCLGGMPPSRAERQFAESMLPVLEAAERHEIDIGIECEPGLYIEFVTELRQWIDALGSRRLGANLDIGHSVVMGERIDDAVCGLAGRIWNLHVEDLPGRKHYHMIPGQGTLDWQVLQAALRRIGYDRYCTVELYTETADPVAAAQQSFAFLSSWAA